MIGYNQPSTKLTKGCVMKHAKILGTGSYLPANRVSNDDLAQKVDTSDEWITSRTGIKFRHIAADNEQTSD